MNNPPNKNIKTPPESKEEFVNEPIPIEVRKEVKISKGNISDWN